MNPFPPEPTPGADVSAAWMRRVMSACRMCLPIAGPGLRAKYTQHGTVLTIGDVAAKAREPVAPFAVRWHQPENATGQWEIYMPAGCISCGSTCIPANLPANDTQGHGGEDGEPGWYILPLDETQGKSQTDADGNSYRDWYVTIHAKISAKIQGEDTVDGTPRHLAFASAWTSNPDPNSSAIDVSSIGDEFSQTVSSVRVTTDGQGKIRKSYAHVSTPISVQSHVRSNFDLVWWFTRSNEDLELASVYCVRNILSVAGMVVKGDTMTNVTAAWAMDGDSHDVVAVIRSNEQNPDENIVEVQVDPSYNVRTDAVFNTNLLLYTVKDGLLSDYRISSLENIQIYR